MRFSLTCVKSIPNGTIIFIGYETDRESFLATTLSKHLLAYNEIKLDNGSSYRIGKSHQSW